MPRYRITEHQTGWQTLENDVDENNSHLASKYYEPPETNEEDE